ncbi:hypothetical protein GCM10010320_20230 [Streptomyces caelestis]|nr:hypothetical protein GCM10010320_20230 [Streptomyces caelestis]
MRVRIGAQFVALARAWGSSFLFVKVALEGLTPAQVVCGGDWCWARRRSARSWR